MVSFPLFDGEIVKANFGFEGGHIVSGSDDGLVHLWDAKTKLLMGTLGSEDRSFGHLSAVNEVATAGSDTVVSASDDSSVLVWSIIK